MLIVCSRYSVCLKVGLQVGDFGRSRRYDAGCSECAATRQDTLLSYVIKLTSMLMYLWLLVFANLKPKLMFSHRLWTCTGLSPG